MKKRKKAVGIEGKRVLGRRGQITVTMVVEDRQAALVLHKTAYLQVFRELSAMSLLAVVGHVCHCGASWWR